MRNRLPPPALVIACIALAVSLSGIGYAAVTLPKNSVGRAQLRANAVDSTKVKNGALKRLDFAKGQLPPGTEQGVILASVPPNSWVQMAGSTATPTYFADSTRFNEASATDDFFGAGVPIPVALYGKRVQVLGAELCYDASGANVALDVVAVTVIRQPSGPASTTVPAEIQDFTNRNDAGCRVYTLPSPATLTENDSLFVSANVDFAGAGNILLGRTVAILQAGTINAVKPTD